MSKNADLTLPSSQTKSRTGNNHSIENDNIQSRQTKDRPPIIIKVRENFVVRSVPRELLGLNHNWIWSERFVMDSKNYQISDDFLDTLADLPLPLNRMSGAWSQKYHWKWAMGPMRDRKEQQLTGHDTLAPKKLGPLEWIKSCLLIDPNARFTWTLNMKSEKASDHSDLAELFRGDGVTNFNGGINWAKKRIDFGLTDPVDVMAWELGNELDWRQDWKDWPVSTYINKSKKIIANIKTIDPDARFALQAATGPWNKKHKKRGVDWRDYHRTILAEIGDQIDYITFHSYYKGLDIDKRINFLNIIRDDIRNITKSNRIKVYISEHASFPTYPKSKNKKWQENWYQTHSLAGCLDTAYFIMQLLSRPEVEAAAYHSFSGGPWGTFYRGKTTGRLYTTGIFDLFKILYNALGNRVVSCKLEDRELQAIKNQDTTFSAIAMSTDDGLSLILLNRDPEKPRRVKFTFTHSYCLNEKIILTADSMDSHNTETGRNIRVMSQRIDMPSPFEQIVVPPKSLITLRLQSEF